MAIKIAHLSDLHFGMAGQDETWKVLKAFLIGFKPDLVLVTGDLADSAQENDMSAARDAFSDLKSAGLVCLVCAGNHDRKLQGVATEGAPGPAARIAGRVVGWWNQRSGARDSKIRLGNSGVNPALFDQYFNSLGMVVPTGAPVDLPLPRHSPQWRVRILSLDSSAEAKYLAQGFVGPAMLSNFRKSARFSGPDSEAPDLVIVLVHHHLLPVRAIEDTRQSAGGLLSSTILVNAGTVLETLVDVGADLILHGHEHAEHLARYSSLLEGRGELTVIGAASATGADTERGSQISNAAFNVLHLGDDLSVSLQEYRYKAGTWASASPIPRHLLGAVDIRRARYLRKRANENAPGAMPSSRVLKQFIYTGSRDAVIRQVTTNCFIRDRRFTIETENASGVPYFMGGTIELTSGETISLEPGAGPMEAKSGQSYVHNEILSGLPAGQAVVRRVEHEILWVAGGVLTADDLRRCDAKDSLREEGREHVGMDIQDSLEALTLSIELPLGLGPLRRNDVEVRLMTPNRDLIPRPELSERLRFTGYNRIAVNIPFPLAGYSYFITWRLPAIPSVPPDSRPLHERLEALALGLALQIAANLAKLAPKQKCSVGIYVPRTDGEDGLAFRLVGYTIDGLPEYVCPNSNQHPFCSAYWGVPKIVKAEKPGQPSAEEVGFGVRQSEAGMIALPLPTFFGSTALSLGLARVAWEPDHADNGVADLLVRATAAVQGSADQLFDLVR